VVALFLDADWLGLGPALEHIVGAAELLVLDHLNDVAGLQDITEGVFDHAWASRNFLFRDDSFFPFMAADHAFELIRVIRNIVHGAEWAGSIRHGCSFAASVLSFKCKSLRESFQTG